MQVEQLTPKLREYIAARFSEARSGCTRSRFKMHQYPKLTFLQMHEMPADPGHAYIIVWISISQTVGLRSIEQGLAGFLAQKVVARSHLAKILKTFGKQHSGIKI